VRLPCQHLSVFHFVSTDSIGLICLIRADTISEAFAENSGSLIILPISTTSVTPLTLVLLALDIAPSTFRVQNGSLSGSSKDKASKRKKSLDRFSGEVRGFPLHFCEA